MEIIKKFYPFQEAVERAAKQNYERDKREGDNTPWEEVKSLLIEEATFLMKTDGENWLPEAPDTEHICLLKD